MADDWGVKAVVIAFLVFGFLGGGATAQTGVTGVPGPEQVGPETQNISPEQRARGVQVRGGPYVDVNKQFGDLPPLRRGLWTTWRPRR